MFQEISSYCTIRSRVMRVTPSSVASCGDMFCNEVYGSFIITLVTRLINFDKCKETTTVPTMNLKKMVNLKNDRAKKETKRTGPYLRS